MFHAYSSMKQDLRTLIPRLIGRDKSGRQGAEHRRMRAQCFRSRSRTKLYGSASIVGTVVFGERGRFTLFQGTKKGLQRFWPTDRTDGSWRNARRQPRVLSPRMVEAAGIEPYAALFEKWRRRATFVVNSKRNKGFGSNSLSP